MSFIRTTSCEQPIVENNLQTLTETWQFPTMGLGISFVYTYFRSLRPLDRFGLFCNEFKFVKGYKLTDGLNKKWQKKEFSSFDR